MKFQFKGNIPLTYYIKRFVFFIVAIVSLCVTLSCTDSSYEESTPVFDTSVKALDCCILDSTVFMSDSIRDVVFYKPESFVRQSLPNNQQTRGGGAEILPNTKYKLGEGHYITSGCIAKYTDYIDGVKRHIQLWMYLYDWGAFFLFYDGRNVQCTLSVQVHNMDGTPVLTAIKSAFALAPHRWEIAMYNTSGYAAHVQYIMIGDYITQVHQYEHDRNDQTEHSPY